VHMRTEGVCGCVAVHLCVQVQQRHVSLQPLLLKVPSACTSSMSPSHVRTHAHARPRTSAMHMYLHMHTHMRLLHTRTNAHTQHTLHTNTYMHMQALGLKPKSQPVEHAPMDQKELDAIIKKNAPEREEGAQQDAIKGLGFA